LCEISASLKTGITDKLGATKLLDVGVRKLSESSASLKAGITDKLGATKLLDVGVRRLSESSTWENIIGTSSTWVVCACVVYDYGMYIRKNKGGRNTVTRSTYIFSNWC